MPVSDKEPPEDAGHGLLICQHLNGVTAGDAVYIWGAEVRRLREWLDQQLRGDNYQRTAHSVLLVVNKAVYEQAYDVGWHDAQTHGESRLSAQAQDMWRDGYEAGFADSMSARSGEMTP